MFIFNFVASTVLNQIIDWIYSQIVGFLGNFFAQMGDMGTELPPIDLVCGGSPCQDLSTAGLRARIAGRAIRPFYAANPGNQGDEET